jgi:hypothetical protein
MGPEKLRQPMAQRIRVAGGLWQVPTPAEGTPRDEVAGHLRPHLSLLCPGGARLERGQSILSAQENSLGLREKLHGRMLVGGGALGTPPADRSYNRAYLMPSASMQHLAPNVIEAIN